MKTRNHVIFFDVDGTLNDPVKQEVPASVAGALSLLKDAGYLLGIATGRQMAGIPADIKALIQWNIYVCNNGQTIYDRNLQILSCTHMPKELVEKVIESSEKKGCPYCLEVKTKDGMYLLDDPINAVVVSYDFFNLPVPPIKKDIDLREAITLIMYRDKSDGFEDLAAMKEFSVVPGMVDYVDVGLAGFNKASGIARALPFLSKNKYIAIGDSLNDIEMFDESNIAIALAGGAEEVKDHIDFLSATPADDGILKAAEWILSMDFD